MNISMVNPVEIVNKLEAFNGAGMEENFKISIYHIIQEQLTNVLKHAKAS